MLAPSIDINNIECEIDEYISGCDFKGEFMHMDNQVIGVLD